MPSHKSPKRNAASTAIVPGMSLEDFLEARGVKSLADIDARRERLPSSVLELSAAERQCLKDPDWIDEDEAATIQALRYEKTVKPGEYVNLREYIRSRGRDVKD